MRGSTGSTQTLSSRDTRAALSFLGDLAGCEEETELVAQLRALPPLIGADAMILGTVRRGGDGPPAISAEEEPAGWFGEERRQAFAHWSHQQPLVVSHFGGLALRPEKVTDFLSPRQWRRREIYNDFYRDAGLHWEIAVQLHASPALIRCAAIQRSAVDFSERDRALLDLLSPHLRAAHARVGERAAAANRVALLERDLEPRGEGALLLGRDGRAAATGPVARRLLREWFGGSGRPGELPTEAAAWLAGARPRAGVPARVLELVRGERTLRARILTGDPEDLVVLSEPAPARPSPAALAARLPLTRRESEVLALLAAGRANAGIAHDLDISPHTVSRHLERVYAKLGVQSRAAATAAALEALL